ncbi:Metallo-dependent hydrolase [Dichomitus squalens]|uniref:Metallo-dependent hydrolase n=1 Tax=Dichomitus squalens TaxID=114155 RepID=A0A4Q9MLU6_9APHY|nr:Metallo-dependent hydrolase [Dichomitus squalens]
MDVDADMPAHAAHHAHSPRGHSAGHSYRSTPPTDYPTLVVRNVHLPFDADSPTLADPLYNVYCVGGRVDRIELVTTNGSGSVSGSSGRNSPARHPEFSSSASPRGNGAGPGPRDHRQGSSHGELDAQGRGILLPALVHAHIHLDKCFLLDQCDELVTGHFSEALRVTAKAKSGFPYNLDDLYDRGRKLISQSIECGVTLMRAHVEVDETVHFACVDTGLRLRKLFRDVCHVQIAVFAQDPLFASSNDDRPGLNYVLMQTAIRRHGVEAVGSAPYVEPSISHAKRNIELIFDLAYDAGIHVDFHLDYNLDPHSEPLIWYVLDQLRQRIQAGRWRAGCHVCVGHATRLTLFTPEEWAALRAALVDERLPLTLVGLPPSDLYMMGRGLDYAPRGTLNVPRLATEHGLRVAMAVNNVENAFTPQGPVDPLGLCPLGVAVFQAGTKIDCRTLLEAVTLNSRLAIGGFHKGSATLSLTPSPGMVADFVLLHDNDSVHSAALNPSFSRTTIRHGVMVARRIQQSWILPQKTPSPDPIPPE